MDIRPDNNDTLSPERAADLLGVSPRTVRRWIASGKLAGTQQPCATSRSAVDALRRQQQAHAGDVLPAIDTSADTLDNGDAYGAQLASALVTELAAARQQIAALAHQIGRLEAQLEQARRSADGGAGRALSRFVPWLRS